MTSAQEVAGFLTPYAYETIAVTANVEATALIGFGVNGRVSVSATRTDLSGVVVANRVGLNQALTAAVNETTLQIEVGLGTDGSGNPDPSKNTATLVAAAVDALTYISAVASGNGSGVLTAPDSALFVGGTYGYGFTLSILNPTNTAFNRDLLHAREVFVTVEGADIRYRIDRFGPQAGVYGHVVANGGSFVMANYQSMRNFRAVRDAGVDATLHVTYLR